ncbi:MAG: aminotransferase class I/II-fold pyridoxal phosphate-dependent enzyme [Kiritimatiellae bacterium]|nr:aminotransferase class I/II-fold pyridoxal phosphate-dependent enzyme [Kiritimatiellia bacterium]
MSVTMAVPEWYLKHMKPAVDYAASLVPNPFSQPGDLSGYVALHQNDYLRLGNHPKVVKARGRANSRKREEAFMSSVYGGGSDECEVFRQCIVAAMDAEDAMLTTSGWAANVGLLEAITPLFQPIYIDNHAHASLYDGVKLSLGKKVVVKHNDVDDLARRIDKNGPGVVVIDAVYSTDGSIGDVEAYLDICEANQCLLVLDEAHSFGLFGNGGGLAVELGLADRVHFRTVSLNKALGGHGGLIAGNAELMKMVRARCRSVIFSSATSSVSAAGHLAALHIIVKETARAKRCMRKAELLRRELAEIGVDTGDSQCQIVSIMFDGEDAACRFYAGLRERKILTSVFVAPAIPLGKGLVRFSVHSELTDAEVDHVVASTEEVLAKMGVRRQQPLRAAV